MAQPTDREHYQAALARLDRFSYLTDNSIRIPFTRFRFGLDPLIGLIPVIGDFAGLILSLYVLLEAHRVGASKPVKVRMVRNILIELFGGLLPVFGDAFDAVFKANVRNTELLRQYLEEPLEVEQPTRFPWQAMLLVAGLLLVVVGLGLSPFLD